MSTAGFLNLSTIDILDEIIPLKLNIVNMSVLSVLIDRFNALS